MFPAPLNNERALLMQMAEGDHDAFTALFNHYRSGIYTAVLNITGKEWQAEEILQDTFLGIWVKRNKMAEVSNFGGWLRTVATNLTLNSICTGKRRQELFSEYIIRERNNTTDTEQNENEFYLILNEAVERLPKKQRETYILIKQNGLKREEAAKRLNVSPETVKSNIDLAIKSIRAYCLARIDHIPLWLLFWEYLQKK